MCVCVCESWKPCGQVTVRGSERGKERCVDGREREREREIGGAISLQHVGVRKPHLICH